MNAEAVALPKWPDCTIYGDPVSPEKATEAIFRCLGWAPRCNDEEWNEIVARVMGFPLPREVVDWADLHEQEGERMRELSVLELSYFGLGHRISSSSIYGPSGWMHWDGTVAYDGSIGERWPSSTSVRKEWERIAEALPWLRLSCVLRDNQATPLVAYSVAEGKVEMFTPEREWAEQLWSQCTEAGEPALSRRLLFEEHVRATAEKDLTAAQRLVFESERGLTEQELRERWTAFRANAA